MFFPLRRQTRFYAAVTGALKPCASTSERIELVAIAAGKSQEATAAAEAAQIAAATGAAMLQHLDSQHKKRLPE